MNVFPRCCCNCQPMRCNENCCSSKHPCCDCFPTRCPSRNIGMESSRNIGMESSRNIGMETSASKKRCSKRCNCPEKQKKRNEQDAFGMMPQQKSRQSLQSPLRTSSKDFAAKRGDLRYDAKQTKNKQNYHYQDMLDKQHMDVIDEEKENFEDEFYPNDYTDARKIQDSCADFLSIVHDNVLETVKKTVENVLGDYFMHTMEKIESVSSQMLRNECLLSKMYLDLLEKITAQSDKSVRQFKCVCRLIADSKCDGLSRSSHNRSQMPMANASGRSESNLRPSHSARSEITVAHSTITRSPSSRKGSELDFSQSMTATERALACATPTLRPKIRSSDISNTSLTDHLQRARYNNNNNNSNKSSRL